MTFLLTDERTVGAGVAAVNERPAPMAIRFAYNAGRSMKRPAPETASIRRRLPAGRRLPKEFAPFVKRAAGQEMNHHGWFLIKWTDPRDLLGAGRDALSSLLPFLRLGDGGFVALWWDSHVGSPRVVACDSEGQAKVVAGDFGDFLARLSRRRTGVPDIDDVSEKTAAREGAGDRRRPKVIPGVLRTRFVSWIESCSALAPPATSSEAQRLRRALVAAARRMIADGASRVYRPRDDWSMDLRVYRKAAVWTIEYLDHGVWHRVAHTYGMTDLIPNLIALAKHPKRARYEVSLSKSGIVGVDRERELVLLPPLTS